MANGLIEALCQLVLSGFKTFQAKSLIDLRVEGSPSKMSGNKTNTNLNFMSVLR